MKSKKYSLISRTNLRWAEKTDIESYAVRQATSCDYLEKLFDNILEISEINKPELSLLFDKLQKVHRRQNQDLKALIEVSKKDDRRSFYFESMYEYFGLSLVRLPKHFDQKDLLAILLVQYVSYLRGKDRYEILKGYNKGQNKRFVGVWSKFYDDAGSNAQIVLSFIQSHFADQDYTKKIQQVLLIEDRLMEKIWRKNERNS
jgi:hypothetical protein